MKPPKPLSDKTLRIGDRMRMSLQFAEGLVRENDQTVLVEVVDIRPGQNGEKVLYMKALPSDALEHLLDRVNSTESALYASELLNQHYREALVWILDAPYGCPYCDSGELRNPCKEHDDRCGFQKAKDLIGSQS